MITCHCNHITRAEIEAVVLEFLADDPWQLIVPNKVYHAMSKRGRCCGCFPGVIDIIIATTRQHHAGDQSKDVTDLISLLEIERLRLTDARKKSSVA
jgi:hypothetical protein